MLFSERFLSYLTVVSPAIHAKERQITSFQRKVYDATCRIPAGQVTTYKLLGKSIGCNCSRAIGQALKVNPFAPDVPCHRVVRTDLSLGGYSGHTKGPEWDRKQQLLTGEGVRIGHDGRVDPEQIFRYEDANGCPCPPPIAPGGLAGTLQTAEPSNQTVCSDAAAGPNNSALTTEHTKQGVQ